MSKNICPCCGKEIYKTQKYYRCRKGYFENSFLDLMLRTRDYSLGFHNDNMTPAQAEMIKSVHEIISSIPSEARGYVHKLCCDKLNSQ